MSNEWELPLEAAVKWGHEAIIQLLFQTKKYQARVAKKCLSLARTTKITQMIKDYIETCPEKKGWQSLFQCFST